MFSFNKEHRQLSGNTKQRILEILLDGPMSLGEITNKLQIQKSAVRVHLESLQIEDSVESSFKIERLGRPRKIYTLTQKGRELFPRKYDLLLSLLLKNITETNGKDKVKKIMESIAEEIALNIRHEIKKNGYVNNLEESLKIFDSFSNELGFESSVTKENGQSFAITSKNCILHKVALQHQEIICHGLHDRIIQKSIDEDKQQNIRIELKECIALGDNFSKHIVVKKQNK